MFLGDPKQQVLTDPQSLNSYSYANDNPINRSDPSGKCAEDGCAVETLATIGFMAGVTSQYVGDFLQNRDNGVTGLAALLPRSLPSQYLTAGVTGSAATVAGAYSLTAGALISAAGYAADRQLSGKPFDPLGTMTVGALSRVGGGFFEWGVGKVPASLMLKKDIVGNTFDTSLQIILQRSLNGAGAGRSQSVPAVIMQNGTTYFRSSTGVFSSSPTAGAYGSQGSVYTSFVAPNAHSACGTLCK